MIEELPIRHAAVEVLESGRFSTASDIWSFGCMAWEVLSAGADPYPDIASFTEVSSFVRAGKRMSAPPGQPVDIHQRLMLPCWAAQAADRPSILELYTTAVSLGAIPDDLARDEMQLTAVDEKPALGSRDTPPRRVDTPADHDSAAHGAQSGVGAHARRTNTDAWV